MSEQNDGAENPGPAAEIIQNCGEPIRFAEVGPIGGFAGVSANAGQGRGGGARFRCGSR